MRLLVLSVNAFPYPPSRGGDEVRTFNLIKHLSYNHEITLVSHRHRGVTDNHLERLQQWVKHLQLFPLPEPRANNQGLSAVIGTGQRFGRFLLTGMPPNVSHWFCQDVQAWVSRFVESGQCDAVLCEHSVNAIYVHPDWKNRLKTIVDIHSSIYGWTLSSLQAGASEKAWRDRLYLPLLARYEKRYCRKFSHLISTTPYDRRQLLTLVPDAAITVIPNGVDLDVFQYRPHDPSNYDLIFVGAMNASHNIDAACFMADHIFPQIRRRYPQATLNLVGANPTPKIQALSQRPGIVVTGRVPSVQEYIHKCTVGVVPLRSGLGIKNKTLEFMAAGIPVVASDRGLEGLTVDGPGVPERALRANQVTEYVDAISRLFEDASLRQRLAHNARRLIETEYIWKIAGQRYEQVLLSS